MATGEGLVAGRVNVRLAERLEVRVGDELVLRLERPGALPGEASVMRVDAPPAILRVRVDGIDGDGTPGALELGSQPAPPANVFVPRAALERALGWEGRANLLVIGSATLDAARAALRERWTLDDAGLALRPVRRGSVTQLESRHVFLPGALVRQSLSHEPAPTVLLAWLADELRVRDRAVPYAIVAGATDVPPGCIRLTDWSAQDLAARPGDRVRLSYHAVDRTVPATPAELTVEGVVPVAALDADMLPRLPGLSDAPSCREWDTGLPIELARIRPRDEEYWRQHRGTPKALLAIADAQRLFGSRFGDVTALRWPAPEAASAVTQARAAIDPRAAGLDFRDVGSEARAGRSGTVDFGGLFLGLNFFLVAAALILTGLAFGLHVERRAGELATLTALGFPERSRRRLMLIEGLVVAAPASAAGVLLGLAYTDRLLVALAGQWSGALAGWPVTLVVRPPTLIVAWAASLGAVLVSLRLALRSWTGSAPTRGTIALPLATAAALIAASQLGHLSAPPAFLGAGAMLLIGGVSLFGAALRRAAPPRPPAHSARRPGLRALALRGLAQRPGRSAAVSGMLAMGVFLLVALESQKLAPGDEGTGGFSLLVECTRPLPADLSTPAGRTAVGLDENALGRVEVLPVRVLEGDDASCLNLARPQRPRVLGVPSLALAKRGAFRFAKPAGARWDALLVASSDGTIPAAVDANTLEYGLGMYPGEELTYETENGAPLILRAGPTLRPSLLQGALLVDADVLRTRFPSRAGVRLLLVDAADPARATLELERALADHGAVVTPADAVLARYAQVQNTYIAIFQILGYLGLLLGSAGLGVMVAASALERRGELALLRAVGFPTRYLSRLLALEHAALFTAGVTIGALSSLLAIAPLLASPGAHPPWTRLAVLVATLTLSGALWATLAARCAVSSDILQTLRRE